MTEQLVSLSVGELTNRSESGRGIVRVDAKTMNVLNLKEGDIIEIHGQRNTAAIAVRAYPADVGYNIVRMDGITRRNAGAGVGETVKVGRAKVEEAEKIVLAPAQKGVVIQMNPELLKKNLFMRPVAEKDIITPFPVVKQRRDSPFGDFFGVDIEDMFFTPVPGETKLVVVATKPAGIVRITDKTELQLRKEAVDGELESIPTVTYEDIGGLGDAILKIREMVELPLRHPELFTKLGIDPPKGVLLYGPPGTGKTLLAKAVANESGATFKSISGPEFISKWYGQSLVGDEPVLVSDGEEIKWMPIKEIVENNRTDLKVLCFDEKGKIKKGKILETIKHKNNSKILEVVTESGRKIRVTDYHSLFVSNRNKIESVKTSELVPEKSKIAVPKIFLENNIVNENSNNQLILINPMKSLLASKIRFEKIKEIKEAPAEEYVYDISVEPNQNFLAGFGGIFAHNSEANLRKIFKDAERDAPSIIFIDEIDAVAPKREEVRGEVEKRIVSQMLALMDGLKSRGKVIVIAATNRPNALDPALRRGGRFDREIEIGVPDQKGRKEVFQIHTRNMPLTKSVDLNWLSGVTYGFVGADMEALCKEAAMAALRRVLPEISWRKQDEIPESILEKLKVTKQDFENALKMVEPSAMREVMIEIPNVKWDQVGGLEEVKSTLKEIIQWPLENPEAFKRLGIKPPTGLLLYGPPGTGKTLLAKAVATESGANFISVRGPEVLSMWVGESERMIRELFKRAKQVAPSVIFFDEIDSIASKRGLDAGSRAYENIVSQILVEMSGLEDLHNVVVISATNRPDMIDQALLRPGRFEKQILVPAPDEKARLDVLKIHTKDMPLDKDVELEKIAKETDGFTGADLEALTREAGLTALRSDMKAKLVSKEDFAKALKNVKPSVEPKVIEFYRKTAEKMRTGIDEGKKEETSYLG